MTLKRSLLFLPLPLVALVVASPTVAQAASIGVSGSEVVMQASPGEENRASISPVSNPGPNFDWGYAVEDPGAQFITLSSQCTVGFDGTTAFCYGNGDQPAVRMLLDDGNDEGRVDAFQSFIDGGPGNDTLNGGFGDDTLDGYTGTDSLNGGGGRDTASYARRGGVTVTIDGAANDGNSGDGASTRDNVATDVEEVTGSSSNDLLRGGTGDNRLNGGAGDDILDGGDGADTMFGGPGAADRVTYATRTVGVTVDIDAIPDDGSAADLGAGGNRDNVRGDVENLTGGEGADTLTGGSLANTLDGGPGPDNMFGGGGVDTVTYVPRGIAVTADIDAVSDDGSRSDGLLANERDNVRGDVENLTGGGGDDTLRGNGAANTLTGGPGADSLFGLAGEDLFEAREGITDTRISCGGDADTVTADTADPADRDCETVNRP